MGLQGLRGTLGHGVLGFVGKVEVGGSHQVSTALRSGFIVRVPLAQSELEETWQSIWSYSLI